MKLRIKELREEFEMTQKELAEKLDNGQRNVSNWENGTSEPDCETILKISDIFNVSIDELFGREFDIRPTEISKETEEAKSLSRMIKSLTPKQRSALKNFLSSLLG